MDTQHLLFCWHSYLMNAQCICKTSEHQNTFEVCTLTFPVDPLNPIQPLLDPGQAWPTRLGSDHSLWHYPPHPSPAIGIVSVMHAISIKQDTPCPKFYTPWICQTGVHRGHVRCASLWCGERPSMWFGETNPTGFVCWLWSSGRWRRETVPCYVMCHRQMWMRSGHQVPFEVLVHDGVQLSIEWCVRTLNSWAKAHLASEACTETSFVTVAQLGRCLAAILGFA